MDSIDINKLLNILGDINKNDLNKAIFQANQIMNSEDKDKLINELKGKLK